jgi:hypothetical protein
LRKACDMNIKPHTMNDLDRYGPMAKLPLSLSSPVWEGTDFTSADRAALQEHFRNEIAPLIEATCTADPALYLEILASLRPHLFDAPQQ